MKVYVKGTEYEHAFVSELIQCAALEVVTFAYGRIDSRTEIFSAISVLTIKMTSIITNIIYC